MTAFGSMIGCASSSQSSSQTQIATPDRTDANTTAESADLGIIDARVGTGARASAHQCLYVHFIGLLADGRRFDTTRDTLEGGRVQEPVVFELGMRRVMPGWEEGIVGMQVGGVRRLWVPYRLAYGAAGRPPAIPPLTDLVFDIELMAVAAPLNSSVTAPRAERAPTCPSWTTVRR